MGIIEKYKGDGLATRFDAGKSIDDVWKEVEAKIKELEAGPLKRKANGAGSPAKRRAAYQRQDGSLEARRRVDSAATYAKTYRQQRSMLESTHRHADVG